jgi:hypothetical protein
MICVSEEFIIIYYNRHAFYEMVSKAGENFACSKMEYIISL